jgi:hypothetical protein
MIGSIIEYASKPHQRYLYQNGTPGQAFPAWEAVNLNRREPKILKSMHLGAIVFRCADRIHIALAAKLSWNRRRIRQNPVRTGSKSPAG